MAKISYRDIYLHQGAEAIIDGVIVHDSGEPADLDDPSVELDLFIAEDYDQPPVLSKQRNAGILTFPGSEYQILFQSHDTDGFRHGMRCPYTLWFTPANGRREVAAEGVIIICGTIR